MIKYTNISIADKKKEIIAKFEKSNIDNPILDCSIIMSKVLKLNKIEMFLKNNKKLTFMENFKMNRLVRRRLTSEPIARIEKLKEFWGLEFGLNKDTLVPRPDSETIIESILKNFNKEEKLRILDLGTGSGCLLLATLSEYPNAIGVGVDLSKSAIKQAKKNAKKIGLNNRVKFIKSNWFEKINDEFDIIISNPPYVKREEKLSKEVFNFDPHLALFADNEGLKCYEEIAKDINRYLKKEGMAFFEIGIGQKSKVSCIMKEAGLLYHSQKKDLKNKIRCLAFEKE